MRTILSSGHGQATLRFLPESGGNNCGAPFGKHSPNWYNIGSGNEATAFTVDPQAGLIDFVRFTICFIPQVQPFPRGLSDASYGQHPLEAVHGSVLSYFKRIEMDGVWMTQYLWNHPIIFLIVLTGVYFLARSKKVFSQNLHNDTDLDF